MVASFLPKVKGRLWIDQKEYEWVKAEAEVTSTISAGGFVARLYPGTRVYWEQIRVNDEVWLPRKAKIAATGRLMLLKRFGLETEITYNDYKKFQSESRILTAEEQR